MIKRTIIIVTCLLFLLSCSRSKPSITTRTYLYNLTTHTISIWVYRLGIKKDSITVNPNANIRIGFSDGSLGDWVTEYYGDSIVVTFDNIYKTAHYQHITFNDSLLRKHHYLYKNKRNVQNGNNYELKVVGAKRFPKRYGEYYYNYTFTEQDYLDAKP